LSPPEPTVTAMIKTNTRPTIRIPKKAVTALTVLPFPRSETPASSRDRFFHVTGMPPPPWTQSRLEQVQRFGAGRQPRLSRRSAEDVGPLRTQYAARRPVRFDQPRGTCAHGGQATAEPKPGRAGHDDLRGDVRAGRS
jgi:hypothetical protein